MSEIIRAVVGPPILPELPWAAGLFEGEGTIGVNHKRTGNVAYIGGAASLALKDRDADVLHRFHAAIGGLGSVYDHKGTADMLHWRTGKFEHVQALVAILYPWLGRRRRQQCVATLAALQARRLARV